MAFATDHTSRSDSGLTNRIASAVTRFQAWTAKRRLYKTTLRELSSLSNRELGDLGLHRSMIRRIAWQAAYEA